MKETTIKQAIAKAARMMWKVSPLILGTILLVSLIVTLIPNSFYIKIFQGNIFLDPLIGSGIGSISAGNPIVSYIIGGELLKQNVSLIAVIAFIVAWVTVGIIQLPAESMILGKRFAFLRNLTAFILSIIVAILTIIILKII
ncbi:hypothetical protein DRN73_03195 [Candidatus Pacearchaeota archaeon]|nr:MAG: hypothetical protein DRN73_03195 [Candidatus Pacearchaeota archaeon]